MENDVVNALCVGDGATLNYDGLIVCISGHGIKEHIITSNYKAIEKTVIHRLISTNHPEIREIPRIFIFDACGGSGNREFTEDLSINNYSISSIESVPSSPEIKLAEIPEIGTDGIQKTISVESMERGRGWTTKTKSEDYNLVLVHAANIGYIATIQSAENGSYLISLLTQTLRDNVQRKQPKGLAEILEDIQNTLHDNGIQQTVNQFNNNTRTLLFKINDQSLESE